MVNFTDLYIEYPGHPRFKDFSLIEDDVIRVIIQKYEMILFTNKGEVMGDPNFGGDLNLLLYETKVSAAYVERQLIEQINTYIEELSSTNYKLNAVFVEDTTNFQEILYIYFEVADYKVYAEIGNRYGY